MHPHAVDCADGGHIRQRGVTFEEPEPVDYEFGVRLTAVDPDGNRISLRQRPGSGGES